MYFVNISSVCLVLKLPRNNDNRLRDEIIAFCCFFFFFLGTFEEIEK